MSGDYITTAQLNIDGQGEIALCILSAINVGILKI